MTKSDWIQKNAEKTFSKQVLKGPKISVIIPVYNCQNWLDNCLKSIIGQTYRNLEIILIDDGSTDESGNLCDTWEKLDSRISAVHQKNKGVSAARNRGISMATGEVYSFIDADDTLESDMYELLVRLLIEHKADIVHCGYKHILKGHVRLVHDTRKTYVQTSMEALECLIGGRLFVGSLWNKLYRSEIVKSIRFREDLRVNEDILYNFEAFQLASTTVFSDYAKYNYIAHYKSSACFVTPGIKKWKDGCEVNKYIYMQLQASPLASIAAERYLRSLSGYYRECLTKKALTEQRKEIVEELWRVYCCCNRQSIGRNIRISVLLIKYAPGPYRLIHAIYDKVRKPNWEV